MAKFWSHPRVRNFNSYRNYNFNRNKKKIIHKSHFKFNQSKENKSKQTADCWRRNIELNAVKYGVISTVPSLWRTI